jgi:ribosomal protein L37AE/L43A
MPKKYDVLKIFNCPQCRKQFVARPDRKLDTCAGCLRSNSHKMKEEQADSRAASLQLYKMVRDEVAMPWERKYTKSMWDRK